MKIKLQPRAIVKAVRSAEFHGHKLNTPEQPTIQKVKVSVRDIHHKKTKVQDDDVTAAQFLEENPDRRGKRSSKEYRGKTMEVEWNPTRDYARNEDSAGLAMTSGVNRGGYTETAKKSMAKKKYVHTPNEVTASQPNPFPIKARKNIILRTNK